jgi:hypothetical protein
MIYYESYYIKKSNNLNMKLNYIFNNMEHKALVTLIVIRVTCNIYVVGPCPIPKLSHIPRGLACGAKEHS